MILLSRSHFISFLDVEMMLLFFSAICMGLERPAL